MTKYVLYYLRFASTPLVVTLFLAAAFISVSGQNKVAECFEIKHLDFFGVEGRDVYWADGEIDRLLDLKDERSTARRSFMLPIILKQIAVYHSCFNKKDDRDRYFKLEKLYSQIRPEIVDRLGPLSFIDQRLAVIRRDFYDQVENDVLFYELIYTMDDGPMRGEDVASFPKTILSKSFPTKFGSLKIAQSDQRVLVGSFDQSDKPVWIRMLKGTNPERYLKRLDMEKLTLNEFEAVTVANLVVDGERLTIYIRPNGRLISYSHSW